MYQLQAQAASTPIHKRPGYMRPDSDHFPSHLSSDTQSSHGSDGRPRKRRRTSGYPPTFQQIALEEIDLEIALRQRIAETIRSRMTWALLLQESMQRAFTQGSENFRTASLDALDAIEAPCDLIFNRESPLISIPTPRPALNDPPPTPPVPDPPQILRNGPRASRPRNFTRAPLAPPKRLLFLRNTATTPPEIAKLACSRCSRSDFSNLQGLLNHCRLRHQLEYGSHDECVQSCAVLVPKEEREWVIQNGVEVAGIPLPSLRRLFEIAVGAGDNVRFPSLPNKSTTPAPTAPKTEIGDELSTSVPPVADVRGNSSESSGSQHIAHVTKTLGYHVDTPALAQFLGRVPRKRRINVRANEDDMVDIEDTSAGSGLQCRSMWRKLHTHRNTSRRELDEVVPLSELPTNGVAANIDKDAIQPLQVKDDPFQGRSFGLQVLAGTRFHIVARIQVSDFSLYIPPNRRSPNRPEHSYRWRITVTSPSYSLPISSVLSKLTVSSVTDSSPSTLSEPITLSEPPFVVTSTTDQPFLARLVFTWAGAMNAETHIEHWVELDPMQYTTAQLGDEQVFDVELDRNTELLPVRDDVRAASWDEVQSTGPMPAKLDVGQEQEEEREQESEWAGKLRSLLPRFPMTMRDTKGRVFSDSDKLPYTLVSTPAQFRSLNYGRRRAIEMGRARTLSEAYAQLVSRPSQDLACHSLEESSRAQQVIVPTDIPTFTRLSTAAVFHWLEEEGLFPRSKAAISEVAGRKESRAPRTTRAEPSGPPAYCRLCGLERAWHLECSVAGNTPGTITEITPKTSAFGRHHKGADRGSLVCTMFQEGDAMGSPVVVDVDALLGRRDLTASASLPGCGNAGPVASAPPKQRIGRLVMQGDCEGMPYFLHPAIFARGAVHEAQDEEDLSASRPFSRLFPGSPSLSARERNAALVQVADPRLVTAIRHMTGFPSPRSSPFQVWIMTGSPSSFHDDVANVGSQNTSNWVPYTTSDHAGLPLPSSSQLPPFAGRSSLATTSCARPTPSLAPGSGIGDYPRDAVDAFLAPSALLAIAMRSFVRYILDRGVEALHHDEAMLRDARQKHLQPHGRGRRNMHATESVRRVLTPAHVLGGLMRHAGAGLVDSAAFLVCTSLGESSTHGDATATGPECAEGGDDDEDGSRLATGTCAAR